VEQRKDQHLDIVLQEAVEHHGGHLLDEVQLIHQSLPELGVDDVRLRGRLFGREIVAPLLVTGMTGGSDRARRINQDLAQAAESAGVPMGVGSMRPMLSDAARRGDYDLRDAAPNVPLLGNVGVMQAAEVPVGEFDDLLAELGFDALCIHLNPAQELAQPEGDRDFTGAVDTLARYQHESRFPIVAKETGAGLSPQALDAIAATGIDWVDVSGSGGTSWTKVEAYRAGADRFGEIFADWGLPTAASLAWAKRRNLRAVASGGVRGIPDILRALALGADLVGAARPVLQALEDHGVAGAGQLLVDWTEGLRRAMVLVAARDTAALRRAPRVLGPRLERWLSLDTTA